MLVGMSLAEVSRVLNAIREMGWIVTEETLLDHHVSINAKRPGGGGFYFACHESNVIEGLASLVPEAFRNVAES